MRFNRFSFILVSGVFALTMQGCGQKNDSASTKSQPAAFAGTVPPTASAAQVQTADGAATGTGTGTTPTAPAATSSATAGNQSTDSMQFPGLYDGENTDQNSPYLTHGEVARLLKATTHYQDPQIVDLIKEFQSQSARKENLPVTGVIMARGFNAGLCIDSDHWSPSIAFKDSNNTLIEVPNLYDMYFENGGFKIEFCYKWIFIILTGFHPDAHSLDGAVYSRGFGLLSNFLELGWSPGANRPGSAWIISPKLGIAGGFAFPKITFRKKTIR